MHFDEKNIILDIPNAIEFESKGFDNGETIQDFPSRGKAIYFTIRSRIWRHKQSRKIFKNDFSLVADGSKLTQKLSDFLKYASQYPVRYDI